MSSPRGRSSLWFVVVAGVMLAVLSWLTVALLQLDGDERDARREAAVQERLRLALWRMDSWLSPQLAREALRPASDYSAFPTAANAWTKGFSRIGKDQVLTQSPLLGAESPLFRLNFEVRDKGICSPQAPMGNERDFAEANGIEADVLNRAQSQLGIVQSGLPIEELQQKVGGAVAQLPMLGCNIVTNAALPPPPAKQTASPRQVAQAVQSVVELDNRQRNYLSLANDVNNNGNPRSWTDSVGDSVGPMVPVWVDGKDASLIFARTAKIAGESRIQAVLVDWERLQAELLALLPDLFEPGCAKLVRCENPTPEEQPSMMATVPARLVAEFRGPILSADLPVTTILWTTWGVTLLGLLVLGFTLRAALGFGERRARFASAVTHELRTPLTTFRMYSEMLADGIVKDPDDQKHYLKTLQRESDRLARVVENVLAWSRLEEGRFTARRQRVNVKDLVDHVVPALGQRLGEVGMTLDLHVDDSARDAIVETDEDAVGQILFNIADNAAKYAAGAEDTQVHLRVTCSDGRVFMTMCDGGPGIAAEHKNSIFVPFDRGAVPGSSNDVPGVGLGLPLARGLARDLEGELRLEDNPGGGACFVLELPAA